MDNEHAEALTAAINRVAAAQDRLAAIHETTEERVSANQKAQPAQDAEVLAFVTAHPEMTAETISDILREKGMYRGARWINRLRDRKGLPED